MGRHRAGESFDLVLIPGWKAKGRVKAAGRPQKIFFSVGTVTWGRGRHAILKQTQSCQAVWGQWFAASVASSNINGVWLSESSASSSLGR